MQLRNLGSRSADRPVRRESEGPSTSPAIQAGLLERTNTAAIAFKFADSTRKTRSRCHSGCRSRGVSTQGYCGEGCRWRIFLTMARAATGKGRRFPRVAVDGAGVHVASDTRKARRCGKALRPEARVLNRRRATIGLEADDSATCQRCIGTIIERESRVQPALRARLFSLLRNP